MTQPKKQLNKRLIALLVAWILPGAPFLGGCYLVLQGEAVRISVIVVLILIPLAFMLWIGHIIVSEESVFEKTVLTVLLWIAFLFLFCASVAIAAIGYGFPQVPAP